MYYDTNFFIFERCVIYTIIINEKYFVYNGHFWIKDVLFETLSKNGRVILIAVLKCSDRKLVIEKKEFVEKLMCLKAQHKYDEVHEIELPFDEHKKILRNIDDCKLRRYSIVPFNRDL
jgi:hypothetical protein